MGLSFALHGHFYQPPRENPWTELVPREASAAPFHDWNSRITAECYRANGWARVLDEGGDLVDVVDNYRLLSFNIGPTLLSWLEIHAPDVYRRVVEADRATGRAIAQAYGHAILPLCNDRDLRTQVRWGLADFRHRFGREAAGMWLPETAVDERVLAVLAEEGVRFTVLAPGQVEPVDADDETGGRRGLRSAYRWQHPHRTERGLDLVVYDGGLSHDVAFGSFSSEAVVDRVLQLGSDDSESLVTVACDGETFGHHQPFADRGVAYALTTEAPGRGLQVLGPAEWLEDHPPKWEATVRTSSWSCAHGVRRWLDDCGCHTGGEDGWNQRWRAPLRAALDVVRDGAAEVFERRGRAVLRDPWAARDAYVDVLLGETTVEDFLAGQLIPEAPTAVDASGETDPGSSVEVDALTLLESQRHALLMYTSCGWFFNDLAGIETLQVLRYAGRCLDLLTELGETAPYDAFLDTLANAVSNQPEEGDGRTVWARHVVPARVDAGRTAGHLAVAGLAVPDLGDLGTVTRLGAFSVEHEALDGAERGEVRTCSGRVTLVHRRTRRRSTWVYGAVKVGAEDVLGARRPATAPPDDDLAVVSLSEATRRGDLPDTLRRLVRDLFGPDAVGPEVSIPEVSIPQVWSFDGSADRRDR